MKLKRRKHKRTKAPISQIRSPSHLKWVRGHVCAIAESHICEGKIEAAHVRRNIPNERDRGGLNIKPSDTYAVPLCTGAHREQHQMGEQSFEKKYDVHLIVLAGYLERYSPHRDQWQKAPADS